MSEHHQQENDYTDRDIRLKPLVIFLVATLVVSALAIIGVKVLYGSYSRSAGQIIADVERQMLEARPTNAVVEGLAEAAESLRRLRADEDALLNHYKWVSNGSDFVQIPVDRAMERLLEKGLPIRLTVSAADRANETPVEAGLRLFTELGCIVCHGATPGALGPSLTGVFGHSVELADGTKVTADEAYVRESILEPMAKVVAGFAPVMPPFKGIVKDDQLDKLVAYITSLGTP
jgi:mono/diheme cytochrome c family protein